MGSGLTLRRRTLLAKSRARREALPDIQPEALAEVLASVAAGTPRKHAARAAGIPQSTFFRYCRVAKLAAPDTPEWKFWNQLKKAEGLAVKAHCGVIRTAADKSWQAAAWWLERLYPEDFGSDRREVRELRKEISDLLVRLAALETRRARK